ncbi:N-acetylglucosamine-6-phosphate deacetylase [Kallotenue papyrolyticum]|uniref:N-acetylglucosamine-6-phosphate deacetylase n=1 Tax=Kallotenue papyrolyticum TaxID=1325125 RepID=UPI00046ECB28|nr:N-acetylglucosamine-6-phosphate deacetylase [Kallotenue papyrolyticum]
MPIVFEHAVLVDATGQREDASLAFAHGRIVPAPSDTPGIDLAGAIVTPGFVDVHTHGGGGYNLQTTDAQEILAYARWAPRTGTTAFLVAVVGVPHALPEAQLRAAVAAIEQGSPAAEPLGIHLEGPYMNPARRGAHDPSWLRQPTPAETEQILALAQGHLRLITLAPELPGADALIQRLAAAGVTVSIGHTDATYEQAAAAIPLGITHATHCFNAMRPLHHREPGALGAIVEHEQVLGELIADGVHVHPAVARILLRALGPERAIIVTDALACAGVPDAVFEFNGQPARVVDGVARLADGTITGSVLTMDQALRNLVQIVGVPLPQAVGMLTRNPARSAGVAARKGRLAPGYDADLLIFDAQLELQATICRGRLAWARADWQERLAALPSI